jgi:hypothetical protein
MDFIDDIDLIAGLAGDIVDSLPQVTDIVHTGMAGSVNLDNIECSALGYCLAHGTGVARFPLALGGEAIYGFRQDATRAGLAGAPGTAEKISVGDAPTGESVAQRLGYLLLPDYFR